jgi:Tfp pilus assembly protein PilV
MLIEVLIILSIVTVGLMALISGVIVALQNTSFSKQSALANHEAETIMENVRIFKNNNGFWCLPTGCFFSTSLPLGDPCPAPSQPCPVWSGTGTRIKVEGGDEKTITVTVRWGGVCDGVGACHRAEVVSFVNKWSRE